MKIYTKTGDQGKTGLIGERVSKTHPRIHIVGLIDEVMVLEGRLLSAISDKGLIHREELKVIYKVFFKIQTMIVDLNKQFGYEISMEEIQLLEQRIDAYESELPVLKNFIYYMGHPDALVAQEIRSKIRTVERHVVQLHEDEEIDEQILRYLNRVSDYFYTLGRYINHIEGVEEEIIHF